VGTSDETITGMTFDGVAMDEQITQTGDLNAAIYTMASADLPSAGTYNAVMSLGDTTTAMQIRCQGFLGVNQEGPYVTEGQVADAGELTAGVLTSEAFADPAGSVVLKGTGFASDSLNCASHGAGESEIAESDADGGLELCVTQKAGDDGTTTVETTLSGSATAITTVAIALSSAATDTTAPDVELADLNCIGLICSGSAVTNELNGTMHFWLTETIAATPTTCLANAQYTRAVTTSPVTIGGMSVDEEGDYTLHACHEDALGNIDQGSIDSTLIQHLAPLVDVDVCGDDSPIRTIIRSQICAPLR
jgi:hypothetical protein